MATSLTKKMKGFADDYLNTGNGTQSAMNNYNIGGKDPRATAAAIAAENLTKPKVIDYLDSNSLGAATRIVQLSQEAENETVKLNANKDILDRAGYKPVEKSSSISLNVDARNVANPDLEAIRLKFIEELKNKINE